MKRYKAFLRFIYVRNILVVVKDYTYNFLNPFWQHKDQDKRRVFMSIKRQKAKYSLYVFFFLIFFHK